MAKTKTRQTKQKNHTRQKDEKFLKAKEMQFIVGAMHSQRVADFS